MAGVQPFVLFNKAKKKLGDGTIDLDTHSFKVALCGSSQTLTAAFTGSSTDCRYADLTGQLSTANGYTSGGAALGSVTWNESGGVVTFDAADTSWTLTSTGITYKYVVVYDDTSANKDLLGYVDADNTSTSTTISPTAGAHTITWNASGLFSAA